jgi:hypothetical protein
MTDHSPSLLPTFQVEPTEAVRVTLPAFSIPAVATPAIPVSQRARFSDAMVDSPHRSALWRAASGRWMNRSFDPAGSEAIRENYASVPVGDMADED